jgi:Lon protease-like protein
MTPVDPGPLRAALDALPLFPLPGVVLFPRALLPLHVFEMRYRAMLADCLASHRCIAMAFVVDAGQEPPRIARVAGAGLVVQHQPLADGRSNILLHGRARVALEELPFVAPYRRARATILEETGGPVAEVDRVALRAAAAAFVAEVRRRDVEMEFALPPGLDASGEADLCAHHLVIDGGARQRALEELDVGARVHDVTSVLAAQTARLAAESGRVAN